jgi:endoglucanase
MVAAHMDEVGVIVTGYDGVYLKLAAAGGVERSVVYGRALRFSGNVTGLVTAAPTHLARGEKTPEITEMYVDIGAVTQEDAQERVPLGTTGVFAQAPLHFGDGFYCSKAIDDRFGCACIAGLFGEDFAEDLYFVFTTQEEVGTRGARVAANVLQPDIALVLESTTAVDYAGVTDADIVCRAGAGPVVPFMDGASVPDKALRKKVYEIAARLGIAVQTKQKISGGTDAGAIQRGGAGARVVGISLPTRNLHSGACAAKISDMEDCFRLAEQFLHEAGEGLR